jgi:hypothetical protein
MIFHAGRFLLSFAQDDSGEEWNFYWANVHTVLSSRKPRMLTGVCSEGPDRLRWADILIPGRGQVKQIFLPENGIRLEPWQLINHFPNHYELTRKVCCRPAVLTPPFIVIPVIQISIFLL